MKGFSCLIGLTLLLSSFYMSYMKKDNDVFIKFYSLLNNEQKNIYDGIVRERLIIYVSGSILGIISAILFYRNNKSEKYILCKSLFLLYFIKLGFYYIYPKQPLMLYSLTEKAQTDAWADIYSEMKNRWKLSIFMGFISYLIIGFAFCRK
jgi:hypothetical protein